jgi:dTDP-4-amino-4,6-dideoxygalactose transaminase
MVKFLDLNKQYQSIKDEIDDAIQSVISKSMYIGGKYVTSFENNFAAYQQAKYCIGVGNGTDAIEIALEALNLPKESEIIVPANSFIASAEAVTRAGHTVVFCDCDPNYYTIAIDDLEKRITSKTKAIIAVHLYGQPCDMDKLLRVAKQYDLKIIEDSAQAHGAEYKGKRIGTIGDIGTFSFYPGKNLGAYGDAGAIVTNDESLSVKIRMFANHGRIDKYDHEFEGMNSRMDGLQGAILDVKLKYLSQWTANRRAIAVRYYEGLSQVDSLVLPKEMDYLKHVYHLFVIRVSDRDSLQEFLKSKGIATGIHYPTALPNLKAYRYLGYGFDAFPVANKYQNKIISLPIYPEFPETDQGTVIETIKHFYS